MSQDVLGYSSHDWRKHTDDAVVVDEHTTVIRKVNACKVIFTHPKTLKEEKILFSSTQLDLPDAMELPVGSSTLPDDYQPQDK